SAKQGRVTRARIRRRSSLMRRFAFGRSRQRSSEETVFSKALSPYSDPASHTFCKGDVCCGLNSRSARPFNISRRSLVLGGRRECLGFEKTSREWFVEI